MTSSTPFTPSRDARLSSARRGALLALLFGAATPAAARAQAARADGDAPRLVVVIAADQLRGDLLTRYAPVFTGGLRRLLREGRVYTDARAEHAITNSLPGHVTIATGMFPSHHGIIDNAFAVRDAGGRLRATLGVGDSAERIIGAEGQMGVSPRLLLATGLPDWLVAADSSARVVAVGSGEYSSLLHAGKGRGQGDVYWFSPDAARYVTSSYYRADYPDWVARFNEREVPRMLAESAWPAAVPRRFRARALGDAMPFENDHVHTTFPHLYSRERDEERRSTRANWLYYTPFLDRTTLALAREAVAARELGRRAGHTDYLSIVVSATDHVGHWFGPLSLEQLDDLYRLDRELGALFATLDARVGRGRYVIALTADHGVADPPEYNRSRGRPHRRVEEAEVERVFADVRAAVAAGDSAPAAVRQRVRAVVGRQDFVAAVMSADELASGTPPADSFVALYRHSFRADRLPIGPLASHREGSLARYGLLTRLVEGAVLAPVPSAHGSPYSYDRSVTLIFWGRHVRAGRTAAPARTVDVAPTLAALAGIAVPPNLDGRALLGGPPT